jgi:alpha-glucosidase/alpha-D-xyloside xylohydrolase
MPVVKIFSGIILGCALAEPAFPQALLEIANRPVELKLTPVGRQSVRITLLPLHDSKAAVKVNRSPALDLKGPERLAVTLRSLIGEKTAHIGSYDVKLSNDPLRIQVIGDRGAAVQDLRIDPSNGAIAFSLGSGPLFGLGEGGPQFNRRGDNDQMYSSQEAYNKPFFGGRMPVPWLMGERWALFLNEPHAGIDLSGNGGRFTPSDSVLPLDIVVTGFRQPVEALTEYARLTGFPAMPPLWALGYEQSHRTVVSRDVVFKVARTFREKKLPCDVLIYLGTGWAPSGWNTGHQSFEFNRKVFPDPPADINALHDLHFKVILHEMGPPKGLHGRAGDQTGSRDPNDAANYWGLHVPLEKIGVDGWWPDEGEDLSRESRLARIRMYWEGPQLERPNIRPYTLNRAGYAGMQRYGGWLWSGDLNSTWETLRNQVPVGINTSLSGVPYWGTDIGGFFSTKELTGELYARWFEFGAFCPVFRSHGRPSALRYPWSWNTGDMGEPELSPDVNGSALPDPKELHNPEIEPVCRKYLELRYRMLPYIYSAANEAHETGLPLMRALWLYYSDDPNAAERGDEYLWGRDLLVAPVTEKGARSKTVYLPRGVWYDFWTNQKIEGGKEITRQVDLATTPLYVRAGAILPMGPLKQYSAEKVDGPLTVTIYPGADGRFTLYDDDGVTFNYERGEFNRVDMSWDDRRRRLSINPRNGAKLWNTISPKFDIKLAGSAEVKHLRFAGTPDVVRF